MQDYELRKKALATYQSFIVQAPAGSGKTSLLTMRFLALLTTVKNPSSVLAMTFTKKAAFEMKERILDALKNCQGDAPSEDHAKQLHNLALAAYNHAQDHGWDIESLGHTLSIMTLDAFCAKVTQTQIRLDTSHDIAQHPQEHFEQVCINALQHLDQAPKDHQEAWEILLKHCDYHESKCIRLLQDLLQQRDQWLPVILSCRDESDLIVTLEHNLEQLYQKAAQRISKHKKVHTLLTILMQTSQHHAFVVELQKKPSLELWQTLVELCLTSGDQCRKTVTVKQGFPSKGDRKSQTEELKAIKQQMLNWLNEARLDTSLLEILCQIRHCPSGEIATEQKKVLQALTKLLPRLAAECLIHFDQVKQQDFIAIANQALMILRENNYENNISQALDAQLHHVLIDEFQDTSPTQFHLIESLVRHWQPNEEKTLFLVGDPMQSIYRFRQADVALFIRVQCNGIASIRLESLVLQSNFRQSAQLVDWCNKVMPYCLGRTNSIEAGSIAFSSANATKQYQPHVNAITQTTHENSDGELNCTIELIKRLHRDNPEATIAVLARARSHLAPLIQALHKHKVAFSATEIESLAEHPGCIDIINLALCLKFPHHSVAWFSLLRSPFVGISLNTLEQLSHQHLPISEKHTLDHINWTKTQEYTQYEIAVDLLSQSRQLLGHQPFALTLQQLFFSLGGAQHPYCSDDILLQIANIADTLDRDGWHHPEHLQLRIEKLYCSSTDNCNLTLMTCHKAKGLEFDHVIVPFTHKRSPVKANALILWQEQSYQQPFLISPMSASHQETDPIYRYLYRKETHKDAHEDRRVFYVTCTRAKQSLHFSAIQESWSSRCFASWLPDQWQSSSTQSHPSFQHDISQQEDSLIILKHQNPYFFQQEIQSHEPLRSHAVAKRIRGLCLHASLEILSQENQDHWLNSWDKHRQCWQTIYLHAGQMPPNNFFSLEKSLKTIVCDPYLIWILTNHPEARSELSLTIKHEGTLRHLVIDRCFIDNHTLWIIDYKTGLLNEDYEEDNKLKLYQQQLNHYAQYIPNPNHLPIQCLLYFIDAKKKVQWPYQQEIQTPIALEPTVGSI